MCADAREDYPTGFTPKEDGATNLAKLRFVLVTAARDEAAFIEGTIKSVIAQTVRPVRWVVVSDGSTDGTDDIVRKYLVDYPWIELVRMPERKERHFAGKVHAFNAGYARLKDLEYDLIGNLDADVTFDGDHFDFLLHKFAENPRLGVAGTPFREGSFQYDYRFTSIEHVSGQIQLFRRECFEDIGGYVPREIGGIDLVAVVSARMKGWQTRTFPDKTFFHHRPMGNAKNGALRGAFSGGRVDYALGCDPAWELFRCIYRLMSRRPIVLYGSLCLAGFLWAMVSGEKKQVPADFIEFRRTEELRRMRDFFRKALPWRFLGTPRQPPSSTDNRHVEVGRTKRNGGT
jgi:glycosyltransferase involved in cell wall biosynthesis